MADDIKFLPPPQSSTDDLTFLPPPKKEGPGFVSTAKQLGAGVVESVPFYGEKLAQKTGVAEPKTLTERTARRTGKTLPYALAAAPFTGGMSAVLGLGGSVVAGQTAEELGVPKEYQPVAEIAGTGAGQVGADVLGRTIGYAEKPLVELYKKAKDIFALGPGSRTAQGMKYGHGETPVEASQNLTKMTELATKRTGYSAKSVDDKWIKNTQQQLGKDVDKIFSGKTFYSDPQFLQDISALNAEANMAFGEKGNVVRTILEKNIGGKRVGGGLIDPQFDAKSLRGAIEDVNAYLANAEGKQAQILHDTAETLHNLAEANLRSLPNGAKLVKEYQDWRKQYTAYATIRDTYQKVSGRTAGGQIPLDELHQEIIRRSGTRASSNPLFQDLAEYGPLFRGTSVTQRPGVATAAFRSVTESPISKALQLGLQPSVPKRYGGMAGKFQPYVPLAQTLSPALKYTQSKE
jgi:hypothetical protein